jgi:hypothetical protein
VPEIRGTEEQRRAEHHQGNDPSHRHSRQDNRARWECHPISSDNALIYLDKMKANFAGNLARVRARGADRAARKAVAPAPALG